MLYKSVPTSGMGLSYILLLTAFYVDNGKNLPLWNKLPQIAFWGLPAAAGIPFIVRALLRHPLERVANFKRVSLLRSLTSR
jgi:hypothetical protein